MISNDTQQNEIAAGIYVHIPFCRSRCSYCGFVSSVDAFSPEAYVRALESEAAERLQGLRADTVFIGGGTPSALPHGMLARIMHALRKNACILADAEITTEANPESCTDAFLREASEGGVNRLSLGIQSLNDTVLRAVGRRHTAAQAVAAVERARRHGIENLNGDLMLGLPGQSEEDVTNAVQTLSEAGVAHLSVYALSVEENTPLAASGYRVDEDKSAEQYAVAYRRLRACGFERYEVSNFCRDGYECRHNRKYWTLAPYVGLGAAAHSFDGNARACNTSDIARYIAGKRDESVTRLTPADRLEEYVMLGLRLREGILFTRLNELYGGDWKTAHAEALAFLHSSGWIDVMPAGIRLNEDAYYVMNEIIVRLL